MVLPACYSGMSTGVGITTSDLDRVLWVTATSPQPIALASGFVFGRAPSGFAPGTTLVTHPDSLDELPAEFGVVVGSDKGPFFATFRKADLDPLVDSQVLANGKTYSPAEFASNGHC